MSVLPSAPPRARRARRGAIAALAVAATTVTVLVAPPPATAAPVEEFSTSFETTQPAPAVSTSFEAPVNVTGKRYNPGSLLPNVTAVTASGENTPSEIAVNVADGNKTTK